MIACICVHKFTILCQIVHKEVVSVRDIIWILFGIHRLEFDGAGRVRGKARV